MTKDYRDLRYFFQPEGVAVIGASSNPDKGGTAIVQNLLKWYAGPVYPINPRESTILGQPAYRSVLDVPSRVDMAVLYVAAASTLAAVRECVQKGVKAVIIESAGFAEAGPEGKRLTEDMLSIVQGTGTRIWGPNCAGFMDTASGVVTLFGFVESIRKGGASFFGQSGLLSGSLIDAALGDDLFGICKSCSIGNKADLNEADFLEYLGEDPETAVIAMYLESIVDGQRFLQAANRISRQKPLLLMKSGRTQQGARAARSHTGSLALDDRVADGAFEQAGIIRVDDVIDLLDMTRAFSLQRMESAGSRVAVVTASGAGGVMACDELARRGLVVSGLADRSVDLLREVFPAWAEISNPIDFWPAVGQVGMSRAFQRSMEAALSDENTDVVFVIMYMMPGADQVDFGALSGLLQRYPKPVVSWGVGIPHFESVWRKGLEEAGIAHFQHIRTAAATLAGMRDLALRRQRPAWQPPATAPALEPIPRAQEILSDARRDGRPMLDEARAKQLLHAYGVPVVEELCATSEDEAVAAAARIGYPVVLKILSSEIAHKSDVGGVKTNLSSEDQLRAAYRSMREEIGRLLPDVRFGGVLVQRMLHGGVEVIIGLARDSAFGPVVMFGLGGVFVEALEDVAFRVAPLSESDAEELVSRIKAHRVLQGMRGAPPADVCAIKGALVAVSRLASECPEVAQIDINPLIVFPRGQGAKAVDAVIKLDWTVNQD